MTTSLDNVKPGAKVEVDGRTVGVPPRTGEVLEVIGTKTAHPHLRVRWDDGHVSTLYAGSDVHVTPPPKLAARRRRT